VAIAASGRGDPVNGRKEEAPMGIPWLYSGRMESR